MKQTLSLLGLAGAAFVLLGWIDVEIDAPLVVSEGGDAVLSVVVPPERTDLTFGWELDDDGLYDDSDQQRPVFSAAHLDGPTAVDIGLYVEDSTGDFAYRVARIEIANVAPTILSEPPLRARRGFEYEYRVLVDEPGVEDRGELSFGLARGIGPEEMRVDEDGVVRWTPGQSDIGTHLVRILVEDKDGGVSAQNFLLEVVDNTEPFAPNPAPMPEGGCLASLRPTLTVGNTNDPDGDRLTYYFEVSPNAEFEGTGVVASPGIRQGIGGFTSWRVTRSLDPGAWYYWRVWVSDGADRSEKLVGALCTQPDLPREFDPTERRDGPGEYEVAPYGPEMRYDCSAAGGSAGLSLLVVLGLLRRRRTR